MTAPQWWSRLPGWWQRLLYGWLAGLPIYLIVGLFTDWWWFAMICSSVTTWLALLDWDQHHHSTPKESP